MLAFETLGFTDEQWITLFHSKPKEVKKRLADLCEERSQSRKLANTLLTQAFAYVINRNMRTVA